MTKIDELIAFHLRAAESCEAFAVTPDADKAKNKDIAKHYQKTATWHREAVEALRVSAALQVEKDLGIERLPAEPKPRGEAVAFQDRVKPWMLECFGAEISCDQQERNHRFLEEALELVQSLGATASEAHQLVDYVYGRPVGAPKQEVGGVMVTLAALCLAGGLDMHEAGEVELSRIWTKVEQIRAKQAAKPAMSPLPGVYVEREQLAPSHSGGANLMADPVRVLQARRIDSFSGWRDVDATTFAQFEKCGLTETRVLYSAPKPPPTITVINHRDDQSALALILQEELDRPRGFTD